MSKEMEKEAKAPDAFMVTVDKFGRVVLQYQKPIFAVALIAILGGVGFVGWKFYNKSLESKAATAIFEVEQKMRAKEEEISKAKQKEEEEKDKANKDKKANKEEAAKEQKDPLAGVDFEKEFGSLADEYYQVMKAHGGTKAALVAGSDLAGLYSQFKKHEKAAEILEDVLHKASEKTLLFGILKAQLATEMTYLGKWNESVELFQEVLDNKASEYMYATILLKLGVVFEQLGQLDRAKDSYLRASTEFADSDAGKTAKNYLRLLEFKAAKNPPKAKEG